MEVSKFNMKGTIINIKDAIARAATGNIEDLDTINKSDIVNAINELVAEIADIQSSKFPVGYVLHCSDCATEEEVIAKYGGTSWNNISGRVIVGANSTYTQGSTGGSADAVVVEHTHSNEAHNHIQNPHSHTNSVSMSGKHSHAYSVSGGSDAEYCATTQYGSKGIWNTTEAPDHTHTVTINANTAVNNATDIVINSAGVSGSGKNMMPYIAEYIWVRTA